MGIYVQQQLEYVKLWKLVEFSQVPAAPHSLTSHLLTAYQLACYLMLEWRVASLPQVSLNIIVSYLAKASLSQISLHI